MGVKFDDKILALWFFNTLPDSWEMFRVSLTNVAPKGKVTMEYVKSGVLNEAMCPWTQAVSQHFDALIVEYKERNKYRGQDQSNRG
jgi:hypothetical protein